MPDWDVISHATPEEVAHYRDKGFVKLGRIFSRQQMDDLRAHVDEMIANLPAGRRPEGMDVPHFEDPWLFRYLADPRVLDIVEDFIGPDIVLWSSHFIAKPRGDGRAVPWHTDGAYWGERLKPMEVITFWLAVDPSSTVNGCMRAIPLAHDAEAVDQDRYVAVDAQSNVFATELPEDLVDESAAVDLELQVGECHCHGAWTVHSSRRNTSDIRRCGYTMRYMPANVVHTGEGGGIPSSHRVYLLRGRDRTGGLTAYAPVPDPG